MASHSDLETDTAHIRTMLLFGTECAACDSVLWKREIFWMYTLTLCSIMLIKHFIFLMFVLLLDVRGLNCFWSSPFDFADRGTRYKDDPRDKPPPPMSAPPHPRLLRVHGAAYYKPCSHTSCGSQDSRCNVLLNNSLQQSYHMSPQL